MAKILTSKWTAHYNKEVAVPLIYKVKKQLDDLRLMICDGDSTRNDQLRFIEDIYHTLPDTDMMVQHEKTREAKAKRSRRPFV